MSNWRDLKSSSKMDSMRERDHSGHPAVESSNSGLVTELLQALPRARSEDRLVEVSRGPLFDAVLCEGVGRQGCGLASAMRRPCDTPGGLSEVRKAPHELPGTAGELAQSLASEDPSEACLGMAAHNALMEPPSRYLSELNAVPLIQRWGEGKRVLMVGGFPFAQLLRGSSSKVWVFELNPMESLGEMSASKVMDYLPEAQLVVLTGTTLINHTFDALWEAIPPTAKTLMVGPSSPLSEVLLDWGLDAVAGAYVGPDPEDMAAVMEGVRAGKGYRQMRRQVRRCILSREGL